MTITYQDIINHFSLSNSEKLQMFVKWIQLSPSQKYPQKSEQMSAPNGIQLDAGQFAYVTLKNGSGKHVFSAYVFADSATSFRQTNFYRITLTHYLMFGKKCKNKIADFWEAYKKADATVSFEESQPRLQRLENLAKRSGGFYEKFLGLAKAHEVINGFDRNQVAEIKRFWDSRNLSQQSQQATLSASIPMQSPFAAQQLLQTATGPAQSPFAAHQPPQTPLPAQSPFAVKQSAQTVPGPLQSPFVAQQTVQAPTIPPMAPQTQAPQVSLQGVFNLLQQLLMANTAQSVTPRVQ